MNTQQMVAIVFAEIEARGIDLSDLGAQSVDEIAERLERESSTNTESKP